MPSEAERMGMCGPGRNLSPSVAEAVRAVQEKLERLRSSEGESDNGKSCYKPVAPLAVKVNNLIEQRDELCHLCGEMLATFMLPENQEQVAAMGARFPDILAAWSRRFEKYSGEA